MTTAFNPRRIVQTRSALATQAFAGIATLLCAAACSSGGPSSEPATEQGLHATIGPEGGELVGQPGSAFAGVHLSIPKGALSQPTEISVAPTSALNPLPSGAVGCGPEFMIQPAGIKLAAPASLTLPFDETTVSNNHRFDDQVLVWTIEDGKWGQQTQTDSAEGSVTVELNELNGVGAGIKPPKDTELVYFDFAPNPKFLDCLAAYPADPARAPKVQALVVRGDLNDGLFLYGEYLKPGLKFDMFTVENSSLLANKTVDPQFKNFGLAWYQSDLEANKRGIMRASIRTILLDQIFGFDPNVQLPPTGTFQVGFWFNDPADAAACGFDVSKPTPFNGEHQAGPLAMISVPNAETGLGPLCTKPDTSTTPAHCSP
jgi:hypothetical protein